MDTRPLAILCILVAIAASRPAELLNSLLRALQFLLRLLQFLSELF